MKITVNSPKILCCLLVLAGMAFMTGGNAHALYTNGDINFRLRNGISTAYFWDQGCRNHLLGQGSNLTGQSLRSAINTGAAYHSESWLSKRGQGNASMPVDISSGSRSIPLQINGAFFLCGPLVQDILPSPSRDSIVWDGNRWVGSVDSANDRRPNPMGHAIMGPAFTFQETLVESISVDTSGGGIAGTVGFDTSNKSLSITRDDNSRYWFSEPIPVTFTASSPLTTSGTIKITMKYKTRTGFWSTNRAYATIYCLNGYTNTSRNIVDCDQRTGTLTITINANSYTINGQSYIKKSTSPNETSDFLGKSDITAYPGEYIYFKHDLRAQGGDVVTPFQWMVRGTAPSYSSYAPDNPNHSEVIRVALADGTRIPNNDLFVKEGKISGYSNSYGRYVYQAKATDVGKQICQRIEWAPKSSRESQPDSSQWRCATVVARPNWNLQVNTTVKDSSGNSVTQVRRGQKVTFEHIVTNSGPDSSEKYSATISNTNIASESMNNLNALPKDGTRALWKKEITVGASDPPGKQYCSQATVGPRNNSGASVAGTKVCVTVVIVYDLKPIVTPTKSVTAAGGLVDFNYRVDNGPGSDSTNVTNYRVYSIVTRPESNINEGHILPRIHFYGIDNLASSLGGNVTVSPVGAQKARLFPRGQSSTQLTDIAEKNVSLSQPVGSRVCRALSINSYNSGNPSKGNTRYAVSCVLIAASPYVSIVGGSSWAGGSYSVNYSGTAGMTGGSGVNFGSTGEYGLFATGSINNFGSAGKLSGLDLTFAKSPPGAFTGIHKIDNAVSYYGSATASPIGNVVNLGSIGGGTYRPSGNVTIGGKMNPGQRVVIYAPSSTVTISSDIEYSTAGLNSFAGVPQLIVIARNIQVNGAVSRIDGNFYAVDNFVSCSEGPRLGTDSMNTITTTGVCSQKSLTINGSLSLMNQSSGRLVLNRSFGGSAAGQPAEVIRFRPESFLTTHTKSQQDTSTLTVVHETELPPRY